MTWDVELRQATTADLDLVHHVTEVSMRRYVEETWGVWDPVHQRRQIEQSYRPETHSILLVQGDAAGVLAVQEHPEHLQLEKIYLLPEYQGRGIGTRVVQGIQARAVELRLPLRLRVLAVNPVRRLYERLGFRVVRSTEERHFMEFIPPVEPD